MRKMKISKFIKELEKLKKENGDIHVFSCNGYPGIYNKVTELYLTSLVETGSGFEECDDDDEDELIPGVVV